MTSLPRISVVVPSYNQGRFIAECLQSIVSQGYPNLELIVMDGGSTDESVEVIRRFERHISYWRSERDGGQSAAINAGVARATGEIVAWLNSDDLYAEGALWTVGKAWVRYPGFGLYIGNGCRLRDEDRRATPFHRRHVAMNRQALREGVDYIQQPSAFFNRQAWEQVGGLDPTLNFCMDWDILIRISDRWPVVTIDEFLSLSREYEDTKTASGGLVRAVEICRMTERRTGQPMTLGSHLYLLESLLDPRLSGPRGDAYRRLLREAQIVCEKQMPALSGTEDGWPERGDAGDEVYVPLVSRDLPRPSSDENEPLPRITVVTPSFNQARYLERTLRSVLDQDYPNLEYIVIDGGSADGSVEILQRYSPRLTHWVSEKDRGPAHAINKGFGMATGELLVWLNSDDMLADGALLRIGRAFRDRPDVDVIFGNALYLDTEDRACIVDHGRYRTALYYGEFQPRSRVPAYWSYVHSVPQPATFFRRSLFEKVGGLDESYQFIFDFELFFRFLEHANVLKLEHLLAFYRIHADAKTSGWQNFLVELYRFSRPWWPPVEDPGLAITREHFLDAFMPRWSTPDDPSHAEDRERFAQMVTEGVVNPELVLHDRQRGVATHLDSRLSHSSERSPEIQDDTPPPPPVRREATKYAIAFCSYFLPRFPGHSGGEIRDFHIVRELLRFAGVTFFASYHTGGEGQANPLEASLCGLLDPSNIGLQLASDFDPAPLQSMEGDRWRALERLRTRGWPVLGPRYPRDVSINAKYVQAHLLRRLERHLREQDPDFLVVSPQNNIAALLLDKSRHRTRYVLGAYDVEAVRLNRLRDRATGLPWLGAALEARRGARFEREHLKRYDGVIAVSELDKRIFVDSYGLDPQRVLVVENGVDTAYFSFQPRERQGPPVVTFVANFGYEPNHFAALRLLEGIMPRVWRARPDAQIWLVGQMPAPEITRHADGERVFVTGKVPSVRPYLARASVMCAPLQAGSGTKYKVLEALSAGAPVICSKLAAEGLSVENGRHLSVRDDDAGLASEILRLIDDENAAAAMAVEGRRLVERVYAWDRVLIGLEAWLDEISNLPRLGVSDGPLQARSTGGPRTVATR